VPKAYQLKQDGQLGAGEGAPAARDDAVGVSSESPAASPA